MPVSPRPFFTGTDSPVSVDSSTSEAPSMPPNDRDPAAGPYDEDVIHAHVRCRDFDLLAVAQDNCLRWRQLGACLLFFAEVFAYLTRAQAHHPADEPPRLLQRLFCVSPLGVSFTFSIVPLLDSTGGTSPIVEPVDPFQGCELHRLGYRVNADSGT
jgi:hypothetical protein